MKFRVLFKTPDTMKDSINRVVQDMDLPSDEARHHLTMQMVELAEDYIQYGENVVLEFDTDNSTVQVKQCRKCLKTSEYAIQQWIDANQGWNYVLKSLAKVFTFSDFNSAMGFVNRIAMWAERNDHHPYLKISWGKVEVTWNTHDADGVTAHDIAGANACEAYFQGK